MVNVPTLTVLFFWIYLFLLMLIFALQWLSLHREILNMCLSQFPLTFCQTQKRMSHFIAQLMNFLVLIGTVFIIIREMFHERISLNSMLLLLLVNFLSGLRLELLYSWLIVIITSNFTHLNGFRCVCCCRSS